VKKICEKNLFYRDSTDVSGNARLVRESPSNALPALSIPRCPIPFL